MKKWLFISPILLVLCTSVHAKDYVRGVQQTYLKDKFGELTDIEDIVCGCMFDKTRGDWSQTMAYDGYIWECTEYTSRGYCLGVFRKATTKIRPFGSDPVRDSD